MLSGDPRAPRRRPRDAINSMFGMCFTCFEAISGYPEGGRGTPLIQRSYRVLHSFRRSQGTLREAEGCYQFNVRIVLLCVTCFEPILEYPSRPRNAITSTFVLCFTCFQAIPEYPEGGRGVVLSKRSYGVSHAFRQSQGTLKEAEECY